MSNKTYKQYLTMIIAFFFATLIPLMILSFYDHPSVDDFSYGKWNHNVWVQTHSVIAVLKSAVQTSKHFWNHCDGLYASAFIMSLQPALFSERWYALTGFINMGGLLIANIFFSMLIMHKLLGISKLEAVSLSMVLTVMMVQWMPSGVSGLYWYDGSMNYTVFFAIMLITVVLSIYANCMQEPKKKKIWGIFTAIFAGIVAGGNHVSAFSALLFLIGILIFEVIRKRQGILFSSVIPLIVNVAGFLFNILSPGTRARQTAFDQRPGVVKTIWLSAFKGCEYINKWTNLDVMICILLLLPVLYHGIKYAIEKGYQFRYPLGVTVLSVGYIGAMFCPPYYAMGWEGSGRLINVVYFAFIILLFINVTYWLGWLILQWDVKAVENIVVKYGTSKWKWYVPICLLFTLVCISTMKTHAFTAVKSLASGEAAIYGEECYARDDLLDNSEGKDVVVAPYSVRPQLLYFDDISEDPEDWRNKAMTVYYRLNSVVKKSD